MCRCVVAINQREAFIHERDAQEVIVALSA